MKQQRKPKLRLTEAWREKITKERDFYKAKWEAEQNARLRERREFEEKEIQQSSISTEFASDNAANVVAALTAGNQIAWGKAARVLRDAKKFNSPVLRQASVMLQTLRYLELVKPSLRPGAEGEAERLALADAITSARTFALANSQKAALDEIETQLQREEIEKKLERIEKRILHPEFWKKIRLEFAEELEDFPVLEGLNLEPIDLLTAIESWHIETLDSARAILHGQKQVDVAKVQRMLLAQWVVFRWLEITEVLE